MASKWILPAVMIAGTSIAGWVIYRKVISPPPTFVTAPSGETRPGFTTKFGRFSFFLPANAASSFLGGLTGLLTGGGTKEAPPGEEGTQIGVPSKPADIPGGTWTWTGSNWDWSAYDVETTQFFQI